MESSAPLSRSLRSTLNIQRGEGARVAWMMLYSVAAVGGFLTVGLAAASSLFLSALPATATPFVFISSGISSVVVFMLYSLATSRLPNDGLVLGSDLLLLAIGLIMRLLLGTQHGQSLPVLLALFLFIDGGSTLVITQFWVRAAQIFDPREAKRLFGLISAGGTASATLASLALRSWAALIGVENLLLIVAAALAVCILCARALGRIQRGMRTPGPAAPAVPRTTESDRSSVLKDLAAILHAPLLLAIAGLTILTALLINTGAYQYFLALQAIYAGRSGEIVRFLGAFGVATGLVALFVQVCLSSRLMRRLGVFGVLLFFPIAMALGAGLGLATGGALPAMALVRAADPVFRQTLNQSALGVLYLPIPHGLRQRAKAILEVAYASSFGLLGLLFLVSERWPGWSYNTWSLPVLGLVALWVLLLRWGLPRYRRALAENLGSHRLDPASAAVDVSDETTIRALASALRGSDELLIAHTLELIAHAPMVDWSPDVLPLLDHPSPTVRVLALQCLGQAGAAGLVKHLAPLLNAPEEEVRAAAASALSTIGATGTVQLIAPFLDDRSPAVRGAALVALIHSGDPAWKEPARAELEALLGSDDPTRRSEGARAVAALRTPEYAPLLIPLLEGDACSSARVQAIRAAGVLRSRELLPCLIDALESEPIAAEAVEALASFASEIEPELDAALRDGRHSPAARARVTRVLARAGTPTAAAVLVSHLAEPDETVRGAIYGALGSLAPLPRSFRSRLLDALSGEIREHYTLLAWQADMGAEAVDCLLGEALRSRVRHSLDRICLLLALLYPDARIAGLRRWLEEGRGPDRAMAIELLDTLLDGETRRLLLPALEASPEQVRAIAVRRLGIERKSPDRRLALLAEGSDRWLRECARQQIGGTMALSNIERVLFLRGAELFSQLSGEELVPVAERAEEVHLRAGETFIHQGEPGDCLYLLVDGKVSIVVRGLGQIGIRGSGGAIGEMAVVWRRPRSADCTALTDISALKIRSDDFWELMAERPALAQGVIQALARRLDQAMDNLESITRARSAAPSLPAGHACRSPR